MPAKFSLFHKTFPASQKICLRGYTSEEWCRAQRYFVDDVLSIFYRSYAMDDEELRIGSEGKIVFDAKGYVHFPSSEFNPFLACDRHRFEILLYRSGIWEEHLYDLYRRLTTDVSQEILDDVHARFGIISYY